MARVERRKPAACRSTALVAAAAIAVALALGCLGGPEPPRAFVAAVQHSHWRQAMAGGAAAGRRPTARGGTTVQDIVKSRVVPKGTKIKYEGRMDPKLRSLLATTEYPRVVDLLFKLKSENLLEPFLLKAEDYWYELDIYKLAAEEAEDDGPGVLNTIRKDWERIWPSALAKEGKDAFAQFSKFWKRLDQSRLLDDMLQNVLPDKRGVSDAEASADQERLGGLDYDERRDEMLRRLQLSPLVVQYVKLSKDDEKVQALAPEMAPFLASVVGGLERKSAGKTDTLGSLADFAVVMAIVVSTTAILAFVGAVRLPFGDETPLPSASQPSVVLPST
eukprot:CAMPEP_0179076038 /NCGR_PEP_ID=MMETSP0796-20121207/33897_1 /TAXON_ID=73915 /ORGANISM="Pyrodinium bahamense, Strain pbaha01" /LENGTH=332 /DNA_ID=CAMNT_0020773283 /DNA_START=16 /DNA_END=1014 /DNA_ORIENTATION=+